MAIENEVSVITAVYYIDKKETIRLIGASQVPMLEFPTKDGFIHSVYKAALPVKIRIKKQTDSQQFKRWFGKSEVVDENGR